MILSPYNLFPKFRVFIFCLVVLVSSIIGTITGYLYGGSSIHGLIGLGTGILAPFLIIGIQKLWPWLVEQFEML